MTIRLPVLLCLLACLQACGFQLRGFSNLPDHLGHLRLEADNLTTTQQSELSRQLERAGATLHRDDAAKPVVLNVSLKSLSERKVVNSAGSNQTIVELSRQLQFSLTEASGDRLIDNKILVQSQNLELDDNNLLGSEGEKQRTLENLDKALFNSLMIQLRRL